jgi:hypothetical protein
MDDNKLGKCCYLEAGERCGCQRYRVNFSEELICDVCFHDRGYHEKDKETAAVPATNSSLLNQVFSGRALEEEAIASELNRTFSNRNTVNSYTRSRREPITNFDPIAATTNYNITQNSRSRSRSRIIREPKETRIQMILLPDYGHILQSPMITQEK